MIGGGFGISVLGGGLFVCLLLCWVYCFWLIDFAVVFLGLGLRFAFFVVCCVV